MQTLLEIIRRAGGWNPGLYLKIENAPYMALVIEATDESGPGGLPAISVAHYGEQNGDLMRDPEMCFEMEIQNGQTVALMPYYYRNDYMGIEEQSVIEAQRSQDGEQPIRVNLKQIRQHGAFARSWDRNLKRQGFDAALQRTLETAAG